MGEVLVRWTSVVNYTFHFDVFVFSWTIYLSRAKKATLKTSWRNSEVKFKLEQWKLLNITPELKLSIIVNKVSSQLRETITWSRSPTSMMVQNIRSNPLR